MAAEGGKMEMDWICSMGLLLAFVCRGIYAAAEPEEGEPKKAAGQAAEGGAQAP